MIRAFYLLSQLADTDEYPATALVVATQMECLESIAKRKDLCQFVAVLDGGTECTADEADAATLVLHFAWCSAEIPAEAHA